MQQFHNKKSLELLNYALWVVFILEPIAYAAALLWRNFGVNFTSLVPIWADEIWYWHQALSFGKAGLNSGYYTVLEVAAPLSHYNAWGLFIPAFYGTVAHFVWPLWSIPIINLILFTIAISVYTATVRPNIIQSIALLLVIATFSPFIIYSASSLLPLVQQTLAIFVAVGFFIVLQDKPPQRWQWISLAVLLIVASLVRLAWSFLFIPYFLLYVYHQQFAGRKQFIYFVIAIIWGGIMIISSVLYLSFMAAPYPHFIRTVLEANSFGESLSLIGENITRNIKLIFEGNLLEIFLRKQIIATLVLLLIQFAGFIAFRKQVSNFYLQSRRSLFYLYMLLSNIAFCIIIYDVKDWRDYRILAPVFLTLIMLWVAFKQRLFVLLAIISMAYILPEAWHVYDIWTEWHVNPDKREEYYAWNAELVKVMAYNPEVNAWCNTVLHSHSYLYGGTSVLLAIDAGIGLSTPLDLAVTEENLPFKSKYLLLNDDDYEQLAPYLDVRKLMVVPNGNLYENLDVSC